MTEKVYYIVVYTVQFDVVVDILYLQQIISYKKYVIKKDVSKHIMWKR